MTSMHIGQYKSGPWLLEASDVVDGVDPEDQDKPGSQPSQPSPSGGPQTGVDPLGSGNSTWGGAADPRASGAYSDASPFAGTFGTEYSGGSGAMPHIPSSGGGFSGGGGASSAPIGGTGSAPVAYTPSAGESQWEHNVEIGLQRNGLPATLAPQVMKQIHTESGGNPNAINNVDSNAQAGHPSQGLLQTIPSTFQTHHLPGDSNSITDPQANIDSAINYAKGRYGPSLMSNGQGMGSGHGYDQGGWLPPGHTHVVNNTGSPELVIPMSMLPHIFKGGSMHAGEIKSGPWLLEASKHAPASKDWYV